MTWADAGLRPSIPAPLLGYRAVIVMQALRNSVVGAASLSINLYITSFVVPASSMSVRNSKSRDPSPFAAVVMLMSGPVLGSGTVWNDRAAASLDDHGKRLSERWQIPSPPRGRPPTPSCARCTKYVVFAFRPMTRMLMSAVNVPSGIAFGVTLIPAKPASPLRAAKMER